MTTEDPYAPRPKASQDVARAKIERQHEGTKDEGRKTEDAPGQHQIIAGVVGLITVLGIFAMAFSQHGTARPLALDRPTTAPTRAVFAPPVVPPATPAQKDTGIPAYAAPDGLLLGSVETTRRIVPVARCRVEWIAYQDGDGLVWLRATDRRDVPVTGPDLCAPLPQTGRGPGVVEQQVNTQPEMAPAETGEKDVPGRTKARATAITRLNLPPPAR